MRRQTTHVADGLHKRAAYDKAILLQVCGIRRTEMQSFFQRARIERETGERTGGSEDAASRTSVLSKAVLGAILSAILSAE